jgi:hypothetical protein
MMGYEVTGVGAFGFSVNWEKSKGDKAIAVAVITFLEDRRLLFGERHVEDEMHCVMSAIEIRSFLTEQITIAKPGKSLAASVRAIRMACRRFVEKAGPNAEYFRANSWGPHPSPHFAIALGDLRTFVGLHVALIASQYKIEVEEDLRSILPSLVDDVDDDSGWETFVNGEAGG